MHEIIPTIKDKFPKNGWALLRTIKQKPHGYIGYMLTIYDTEDDVSIIHDLKGRNLKSILSQLKKLSTSAANKIKKK